MFIVEWIEQVPAPQNIEQRSLPQLQIERLLVCSEPLALA
jgi:hypothetical protein